MIKRSLLNFISGRLEVEYRKVDKERALTFTGNLNWSPPEMQNKSSSCDLFKAIILALDQNFFLTKEVN